MDENWDDDGSSGQQKSQGWGGGSDNRSRGYGQKSEGRFNQQNNDRGQGGGRGRGFRRGQNDESRPGGFGSHEGISNEPEILWVETSKLGRIIGKGGSKIRELQDDTGASINIERDNIEGSNTGVRISGTVDAQERAKDMIHELTSGDRQPRNNYQSNNYQGNRQSNNRGEMGDWQSGGNDRNGSSHNGGDSEMLWIESSKLGRIIGKGGSKIRELQEDSGASINIERDNIDGCNTGVKISGSADSLERVKGMITELTNLDNRPPRNNDRQSNNYQAEGWQSDAQNSGQNESTPWGGGTESSAWGGGHNSANTYSNNKNDSELVWVESSKLGKIIGRGGSKIRELQDDSGASINIEKENIDGCNTAVRISGSSESKDKVKQLINELTSGEDNRRPRDNYSNQSNYQSSQSNDYSSNTWQSSTNQDSGNQVQQSAGEQKEDYAGFDWGSANKEHVGPKY